MDIALIIAGWIIGALIFLKVSAWIARHRTGGSWGGDPGGSI